MEAHDKAIDILLNEQSIHEKMAKIRNRNNREEFIDESFDMVFESDLGENFVLIEDDDKKDLTELNASSYNSIRLQDGLSHYTTIRHTTKNAMSLYGTFGSFVSFGRFAVGILF